MALLDLSVMVTYGGEQSLDRYLALSARAIPFNLAHAAGNFALALVAGPALVRLHWPGPAALLIPLERLAGSAPGVPGAAPRRR